MDAALCHFDDPASQGCAWAGMGVSFDMPATAPGPSAVAVCRQDFVVTSVTPIE
jgi:hypothetical protein